MKKIKYRTIKHSDYLTYSIPESWIHDNNDEDGIVTIYDEDGLGALTMSFYTVMYDPGSLISFVGRIERDTATQSNIELSSTGMIFLSKDGKHTSAIDGMLSDGTMVKLWVIAKERRFIVATYIYEKKTKEYSIMDEIIKSITINF